MKFFFIGAILCVATIGAAAMWLLSDDDWIEPAWQVKVTNGYFPKIAVSPDGKNTRWSMSAHVKHAAPLFSFRTIHA